MLLALQNRAGSLLVGAGLWGRHPKREGAPGTGAGRPPGSVAGLCCGCCSPPWHRHWPPSRWKRASANARVPGCWAGLGGHSLEKRGQGSLAFKVLVARVTREGFSGS